MAKKSSGGAVAKNIGIIALVVLGVYVALKLVQSLISRLGAGGSDSGEYATGAGSDYLGVPYPPNYQSGSLLQSLLNALGGGKSNGGSGSGSGLNFGGGSGGSGSSDLSLASWLTNEQQGASGLIPGFFENNPLNENFSIPYEPYVNAPTGEFDFNGPETQDYGDSSSDWTIPYLPYGNVSGGEFDFGGLDTGAASGTDGGGYIDDGGGGGGDYGGDYESDF